MPRKYLIETLRLPDEHPRLRADGGLLEQAGYEPTEDDRDADVIVINTCSVRERARKSSSRGWENPADGAEEGSAARRRGHGCVAQQEGSQILNAPSRRRHRRYAESETPADARRARGRAAQPARERRSPSIR
jgi:hypothetical protein